MKRPAFSLLLPALLLVLGGLTASSLLAQAPPRSPQPIQPTAADDAAAASAVIVYSHALTAKTDAGAALKSSQALSSSKRAAALASRAPEGPGLEGNDQLRFPADLTFFGGPTVPSAQSHGIFLVPTDGSCPTIAACWGDPLTFLDEYGESGLSHVTDQYVGQSGPKRYTLGDSFAIPYAPTPPTAPLTDFDILGFVHAVAGAHSETGYNHIFHVFLPPGQDLCTPLIGIGCYAPGLPTFSFCAFHISVTFNDIGHVLFSVEPFQSVRGCQVRTGTPNGQLIDSTNSTLSHELTETITDPDGDAWFNFSNNRLFLEEIGDECQFIVLQQISANPPTFAGFGDPTTFSVGKNIFATQPEYSNEDHACAIRP